MSLDRKFEKRKSKTIVQNPVASVATGTAVARVTGLHGSLFIGVGLAYFPDSGKQPAGGFGTNAFSLIAYACNEIGKTTQLSATPVNGATGQLAPDMWEGSTTLKEFELQHAWVGLGAADVGHWEVIVTIVPAIEMCEEDFELLANQIDILIPTVVTA